MILDEIVANKRLELSETKRLLSLEEVQARLRDVPPPRNFRDAIDGPKVALIAEIKRASPSMGEIGGEMFDPRIIAQTYSGTGAAALSVLTERRYFQGEPQYIRRARKYMPLPILRKDFIVEPYQIYESRMLLADAVLLIVRILTDDQLFDLLELARELRMAALVEAHDEPEVDRAAKAGADIVGINNRDLSTMTIDLATTERLAPRVPRGALLVSESGIETREDVERLSRAGAHAILVGTTLMKAGDAVQTVMRPLAGVYRPGFEPEAL
jgi:indole-3-glycerol phosphate synthase